MNKFYFLDISLVFVLFFLLLSLSFSGILPSQVALLLPIGLVIGLAWELTHALLPGFLVVPGITGNRVRTIFYVLAHSMWDSLILLGSAYFVRALGMRWEGVAALVIIVLLGLVIEIVVEFVGQSRTWTYASTPLNPTLFRVGKVSYTFWPLWEWVIAGVVYWLVLRALEKSS